MVAHWFWTHHVFIDLTENNLTNCQLWKCYIHTEIAGESQDMRSKLRSLSMCVYMTQRAPVSCDNTSSIWFGFTFLVDQRLAFHHLGSSGTKHALTMWGEYKMWVIGQFFWKNPTILLLCELFVSVNFSPWLLKMCSTHLTLTSRVFLIT